MTHEPKSIQLILASQSPRRKELLSYLQVPFEIQVSHLDEVTQQTETFEIAKDLAMQKAQAVFQSRSASGPSIIIGADTIVAKDHLILGKPKHIDDACQILQQLSGSTHSVITGVALIFHDVEKNLITKEQFAIESIVEFDQITAPIMENYLNTKDSLDKAGAYGIQGAAQVFIKSMQGSFSNVVGLPIYELSQQLRQMVGATPDRPLRDFFRP